MNKLPKKFPEYLILYKTFANQIKLLEKRKEINAKIENYQSELIKIRRMFPDKFFEEIN